MRGVRVVAAGWCTATLFGDTSLSLARCTVTRLDLYDLATLHNLSLTCSAPTSLITTLPHLPICHPTTLPALPDTPAWAPSARPASCLFPGPTGAPPSSSPSSKNSSAAGYNASPWSSPSHPPFKTPSPPPPTPKPLSPPALLTRPWPPNSPSRWASPASPACRCAQPDRPSTSKVPIRGRRVQAGRAGPLYPPSRVAQGEGQGVAMQVGDNVTSMSPRCHVLWPVLPVLIGLAVCDRWWLFSSSCSCHCHLWCISRLRSLLSPPHPFSFFHPQSTPNHSTYPPSFLTPPQAIIALSPASPP